MARSKSTRLRERLTTLLPTALLRDLAVKTRFVQRERKVDPAVFVWTLVFGFACGTDRTIAGLRRAYEIASKTTLVPSAFYDRFNKGLVAFLAALVAMLIERVAEPCSVLQGELAGLKDLVVTDSTVIRLHRLLERAFPATRTNHTKAAAKLHVLMSVLGRGPRSIKLTSERVHDGRVLRIGPWVKDRLLLFDLGYYRFQLFDCIDRNGGFFLTRLKKDANPLITKLHKRWRGASVPIEGQRLQDVLARLQREILDVEITVRFKRRVYAGKQSSATARFRLVGIRNETTGDYHLYVTNVPASKIKAKSIAAIYRARWSVELLFKSLKSDFWLEDMPSSRREVIEALIYATVLTWIASKALLAAVQERLGQEARRATEGRWTHLLRAWAHYFLLLVTLPPRETGAFAGTLERLILHEALDPHSQRSSLLEEAQAGTLSRRLAPRKSSG